MIQGWIWRKHHLNIIGECSQRFLAARLISVTFWSVAELSCWVLLCHLSCGEMLFHLSCWEVLCHLSCWEMLCLLILGEVLLLVWAWHGSATIVHTHRCACHGKGSENCTVDWHADEMTACITTCCAFHMPHIFPWPACHGKGSQVYNGIMVQWQNGTMVQWLNGTMVQCVYNGRGLQVYNILERMEQRDVWTFSWWRANLGIISSTSWPANFDERACSEVKIICMEEDLEKCISYEVQFDCIHDGNIVAQRVFYSARDARYCSMYQPKICDQIIPQSFGWCSKALWFLRRTTPRISDAFIEVGSMVSFDASTKGLLEPLRVDVGRIHN